jgi:HlyD family secretion protein
VTVAEGNLAQTKAALRQAEVNLDYTTIRSPVDGIVLSRNVDVGQTVAASMQAPVLFTIAEDLRKIQVDTSVSEGDVGKLSAGTEAGFTVDAYAGERFSGTVRQIRYNASTVQNVVTYDAVIDVANPDGKLMPGMTANVSFTYADKDEVLRVPNAALRFRAPVAWTGNAVAEGSNPDASKGRDGRGGTTPKDRRTVWVLRDGKPVAASIRIGISDGRLTEVVEGDLAVGDLLVTDAGAPDLPASSPMGAPGSGQPGVRRMF